MLKFITLLKAKAQELGFCDAGATEIGKADMTAFKAWLDSGCNAKMEYMEKNMAVREHPSLLLEGSRSIIMAAIPYPEYAEGKDGLRYAGFANGLDYHFIIKSKLKELAGAILPSGTEWRVFSDSAPIFERYWAQTCGLGVIGKNNFLISFSAGARVLLGTIISTYSIPSGESPMNTPPFGPEICEGCSLCIKACPNGALKGKGLLNANRCISYHTIESKEDIPETITTRDWVIGCEECLIACPYQTIGYPSVDGTFTCNRRILEESDASWWERQDRNSFRQTFKGTAFERPGLEKIRNNIRQAKGCKRYDKDEH